MYTSNSKMVAGKRKCTLKHTPLLLILNVLGFQMTMAQETDVRFHIFEEESSGKFVGDVAVASNVAKVVSGEVYATLRYNFLDSNSLQTASLFSINRRTGKIYTTAMIDRESVCNNSLTCVLKFDVTVQSNITSPGKFFIKIVTVMVYIDDKNDNAPTFKKDHVTLTISETAPIYTKISLPGATDMDTGANNSVKYYEIISSTDTFAVEVAKNLAGSMYLRIIVLKPLDREVKDLYNFTIVAKDGGEPQKSGSLDVSIKITDENDNAPEFTQETYKFDVKETTSVNSVVGKILAQDRDLGDNAKVEYKFSPLRPTKVEELFSLDRNTGELIVKRPLPYEAGSRFETVVEAADKGNPPQTSQARVVVTVLDVGNTPPKMELNLASAVYSDTILLSEGSRIETFVGRVKVEDKDSDKNGKVQCRSLDKHFKTKKLDDKGYAILVGKELDRESKEQHNVSVICEDSGSPSMSASVHFLVLVTDINDNSPVFGNSIYYANLTENNRVPAFILKVSASDKDLGANGDVHYMLNWDSSAEPIFTVDSKTGEIRANQNFDRETISEMTFSVKAVDHGSYPQTGTATIVVTILDQNDNSPEFLTSPVQFYIPEGLLSGRKVGHLTTQDDDEGINAEVRYRLLPSANEMPFVVFSDGIIRTDRVLDRESRDQYEIKVVAYDRGVPSLNSTGRVVIIVQDTNDNSPTIHYPVEGNNTVVISSDMKPGTIITTVNATDEDEGSNKELMYFVISGNKDGFFSIGRKTGDIILSKRITMRNEESYRLMISVQDGGQQQSQEVLNIKITFTNKTIADSIDADGDAHKYMIIAGVVAGVTVIVSIIILTIILQIRRSDNHRRQPEEKTGVQEETGRRELERRIWQEVSSEDIKAGFDGGDKTVDKLFKAKMDKDKNFPLDPEQHGGDSFLTQAALDSYAKQDFFTFRKGRGPSACEDVRSDASGETTTSDSGRGGSEEDIQLPPLPELAALSTDPKVFSVGTDNYHRDIPPRIPPRQKRPGNTRTFTTFSNPNMANTSSSFNSFRDIHSYGDERHPQKVRFHNEDIPVSYRSLGSGKHVAFPKEPSAVTIRSPLPSDEGDYLILKNHFDGGALSYLGSYNSLPRSVDDDDNTTTSGSYTLNPEDFEEVFCER